MQNIKKNCIIIIPQLVTKEYLFSSSIDCFIFKGIHQEQYRIYLNETLLLMNTFRHETVCRAAKLNTLYDY